MKRRSDIIRARVDAFSVFDWANTPFAAIFWRELVVALRHRRYAMLLGGLAVALLLAITFDFGRMLAQVIPTAELVTNVVGLQCSALLLILFFVIPALSAVTVAAERRQETEDLLHMALGDPLSLLAGKLLAMLALFAVFHLALLPFSVFTYFFAGIEVGSFFQITFMLYGTALCHSIIGVAVSRTTQHPGRALFWAYAGLFALYIIPSWMGNQLVMTPALGNGSIDWYLNPLPLLRDLLHSIAGWVDCLQFLGFQLLATTFIVVGCGLATGREGYRGQSKQRILQPTQSLSRHRPFRPMPDWGIPTYHRDCHTAALARPAWTLGTFVLGILGAAVFTFWSARYTQLSITAAEAGTAALILLTPLLVLERCSKEMDPISLLMLRVTRLRSDQVLQGKALAAFRCLLPLTLGIVAGCLLPLVVASPTDLTGGHPATPNRVFLIYQAALLPPKLAVAVVLCFACLRYRAPNATDLAITLVLSTLVLGGAELVRGGLFDTVDWKKLTEIHLALLYGSQLVAALFGGMLVSLIALMRFEAVFDEGSDIFAVRYVDRRSF